MDLTGAIRIVERGDPFTVREWREMAESRAFRLFVARLEKMIASERHTCEQTTDADAWRRAQGAIKTLFTVCHLPAIIEAELEGKR